VRMFKVVALVAALSGCSVAFQSKPKAGMTSAQSGCSTTHAWWVTDAVAAMGIASAGVATYATQDTARQDTGAAVAAAAFGSLLFIASARRGHTWREQCVAAPTVARA